MQLRSNRSLLVALLGLSFAPSLFAQSPPPARPSAGDLREEQRLIDNAYLGDADFQIKRARERLGGGNNRLAQQSGLWALEQVAYAKRRLERHAPKIEEAGGFFGRASESTRKELRDSYALVREKYVTIEERLDTLAESLKKAGLPILAETLNNVRSSSGDGAVQAAQAGLSRAGERGQGDKGGGGGGGGGGDNPVPPPPITQTQSTSASIPGIPGATAMQAGPGQVSLNIPGVGPVTIQGTLSPDGRYIDSPYGRVDLSTGVKLPDGSTAFQTDKGVLVLGKDGQWHLMAGAKLNPDGSVTMPDGRSVSAAQVGAAAMGTLGPNPGSFSGRVPPGTVVLDQNGNRITIDADFQNGEQTGVKKDYIGGAGATLVSETKVTRKLVQATGSEWRVNVVPGESRSWNFAIRMGDQKSSSGSVNLTLTVDGGGATGFTIRTWDIADDKGNRASVTPSTSNPAQAVATFTKGGEYTFSVAGETDWGSQFRVKGQGGVYP